MDEDRLEHREHQIGTERRAENPSTTNGRHRRAPHEDLIDRVQVRCAGQSSCDDAWCTLWKRHSAGTSCASAMTPVGRDSTMLNAARNCNTPGGRSTARGQIGVNAGRQADATTITITPTLVRSS
jgi:hypothetical protein